MTRSKIDDRMDVPKHGQWTPQQSTPAFVVAVVALASIGNFVSMAMLVFGLGDREFYITCFFSGLIGAQIALLAVWVGLLSGELWQRVMPYVAMGVVCIAAWLLGLFVSEWSYLALHDDWLFPRTVLLCYPLISLSAQAPFWLMRLAFSWRIMHDSDATAERPLAIRDIMAATGGIAFVLGMTRYAKPPMSSYPEFMMFAGVSSVVALVGSAAITLPLVFGVLRTKDGRHGCVVTVVIFGAIGFLLLLGLGVFLGSGAPAEVFAAVIAFFAGLILSQAVVLLIARNHGYVIKTPRDVRSVDDT